MQNEDGYISCLRQKSLVIKINSPRRSDSGWAEGLTMVTLEQRCGERNIMHCSYDSVNCTGEYSLCDLLTAFAPVGTLPLRMLLSTMEATVLEKFQNKDQRAKELQRKCTQVEPGRMSISLGKWEHVAVPA